MNVKEEIKKSAKSYENKLSKSSYKDTPYWHHRAGQESFYRNFYLPMLQEFKEEIKDLKGSYTLLNRSISILNNAQIPCQKNYQ